MNFSSARATGVGVKPVKCLHTVNTAIQLSNMKHLGSIRAAQVYERFQFRSPVIFRLKEKKKRKNSSSATHVSTCMRVVVD